MPGNPNEWTYTKDGVKHVIEWGDGLMSVIENTVVKEYREATDPFGNVYWKLEAEHKHPGIVEIANRMAKIIEGVAP